MNFDESSESPNETPPSESPGASIDPVADKPASTTPYEATPVDPQDDIPVAQAVVAPPQPSPSQSHHPRWWTPLALTAVSLFLCLSISAFMLFFAMVWVDGDIDVKNLLQPEYLGSLMKSRVGFCCLVIPPQLMLLFPSIIAAFLSPVRTDKRLSCVRGHWPIWAWVGTAAAAPLIGLISSLVLSLFMTQSDSLQMMSDAFTSHSKSGFLIPLALIIGLTPAICEEILFRGYIQTRLNRSFGPAIGIFVASFLFAAFHMDTVHSVAVFPLGLFLGVVAWRSGSIFPAMLAHFVNNVISVVGVAMMPAGETDVLAVPSNILTYVVLITGIIGVAAVVTASIAYKPAEEQITGNGSTGNGSTGDGSTGIGPIGNQPTHPQL